MKESTFLLVYSFVRSKWQRVRRIKNITRKKTDYAFAVFFSLVGAMLRRCFSSCGCCWSISIFTCFLFVWKWFSISALKHFVDMIHWECSTISIVIKWYIMIGFSASFNRFGFSIAYSKFVLLHFSSRFCSIHRLFFLWSDLRLLIISFHWIFGQQLNHLLCG